MTAIFRWGIVCAIWAIASFITPAQAEEDKANYILFKNVNVFDGVRETLDKNTNVLIENNLIKSVGSSITAPVDAEVIDGNAEPLIVLKDQAQFRLASNG